MTPPRSPIRARPTDSPARAVRFRPSRVDGWPEVDEVRVDPEWLEIRSAGRVMRFPLRSMAAGREIATGLAPVGELHWSAERYADAHVDFYTTPRLAIYMPADGPTRYPDSHFWLVQDVLRQGRFKLYDGGPPKQKPAVLDPRPERTVLYVVAVYAAAWCVCLSGYLPGAAGAFARGWLLGNRRKPELTFFMALPTLIVPVLLSFRHGRSAERVAAILAYAGLAAVTFEWSLRLAVHPWAPLDRPPFNLPFWSPRRLVLRLFFVAACTLVGASWRNACLEPLDRTDELQP